MDPSGKTLRRLSVDNKPLKDKHRFYAKTLRRVDIGGVTYVQKSPDVLERTNIHHARTLLRFGRKIYLQFSACSIILCFLPSRFLTSVTSVRLTVIVECNCKRYEVFFFITKEKSFKS